MEYEVMECPQYRGEWLAEAIGEDGEVYMVRFSGPKAEERARQYARLMMESLES